MELLTVLLLTLWLDLTPPSACWYPEPRLRVCQHYSAGVRDLLTVHVVFATTSVPSYQRRTALPEGGE